MNTLSIEDFRKSIAKPFEGRLGKDAAGELADILLERQLATGLEASGYDPGTVAKGLQSNSSYVTPGTTGGDAIKPESLYDEVVSTELSMKDHAVLWNDLTKVPVTSDYVQKVELDDFGGGRRMGFINPSDAAGGVVATDPHMQRRGLPVRWLGGRYQTFTTANAVRGLGLNGDPAVGNAEEINSEARLQRLILNANEMCWWGQNAYNSYEPDGVITQIRGRNSSKKPTRYDMKGQPFTRDNIPTARKLLKLAGGAWSHLYWSSTALSDFEKTLIGDVRYVDGRQQEVGLTSNGALIRDLGGNPAHAKFREDQFLESLGPDTYSVQGTTPPAAPSSVTGTPISAPAPNAFGSYLAPGVYYYSVNAVGINGRSLPTAAATSVTVTAGQKAQLTITNGDANAVFFEVYRGTSTSNRQYLGRVTAQGIGLGSTQTFVDDGEFYPGTSTLVALTIRPMRRCPSIHVCQLYPTTKVELPRNLMANEAGWILGITPRVLNEVHCMIFENVGQLS